MAVRSSGRNPEMNRILMLTAAAALLVGSTGCLHHHTRGGLGQCEPANCEPADGCEPCGASSNGGGILGKLKNAACKTCGRTGCVAGKLGWQRGGHNYSSHLSPAHNHAGAHGPHAAAHGPHGGHHAAMQSATMAYPYYTIRSPRDFLMDNPPTIGY
jgi:hypothetical protein